MLAGQKHILHIHSRIPVSGLVTVEWCQVRNSLSINTYHGLQASEPTQVKKSRYHTCARTVQCEDMSVNPFPSLAKRFIHNRKPRGKSNKVVRFIIAPIESIPTKAKLYSFKEHFNIPRRATRDDWIHDGTFHDAIAGLLLAAQFCGVMPVCGITAKDPKMLYFSWKSKRTFYTYAACLGTAFFSVNAIIRFFMRNFSFVAMTVVFFYTYNLYGLYCFLRVAQKWPALIRRWHQVEQLLPQSSNLLERAVLAKKIKLISTFLITMSLMEHLISIISAVYYSPNCPEIPDPLDKFMKTNFIFIFHFFKYSKLRGFFVKLINVISTFVWSYVDLFVIVVSIGLSHCYKRINEFLMEHKRKKMTERFWGEQRVNYRNICDLVQSVDDVISVITMLSISNNLFYICISILNSLNSQPTIAHMLYFWFGLAFLIGRTLAVTMYAAEVNDESMRPIEVLRTIPREGWCLEAKRFTEEVINDTVALTGMKFFNMTRQLVLKVTGTIITYELVLIQFHQNDQEEVDLCTMQWV
ncbi:gustatory receptor for sugar taste 64e-like [Malaya genurostris]|uniref:gustatory receptor for sugar taste 64e-like n=1 Tax=Malaya genurostris TaxID=325434 RepID=UPI0026F3C24F|nr:gustatory receptor for sugar taste 64e-like [Malaya genurostris]